MEARSKQTSFEQSVLFGTLLVSGFVVVLVWMALLAEGDSIARAFLNGKPMPHFQRGAYRLLLGVPEAEHVEALRSKLLQIAGRVTVIFVGCGGIVLFGSLRQPHLFRNFFSAAAHPLTLAILRIVYFLTLLPRVQLRRLIELSQLDPGMRAIPPGLGWFSALLPQSADTIQALYAVFVVACLLGLMGLGTRAACVVATALSFYMLGAPQLFGKIHHHHHIIWIGALLACSRASDMLSVDALLRTLRGKTIPQAPAPATHYGLPLRFVWLFLGIIYFFPGFWKYVISGNAWFLSENLQNRMLMRLFVGEGWQPIVRMDQYDLLCTLGGVTTIVMEMAFIFLLFLPRLRYLAAVSGLFFHTLVKAFLNISFWPIQAYYVTFIDFHALLRNLALETVGKPLSVEVPVGTHWQRLVRAAQILDVFSRLQVQEAATNQQLLVRSGDQELAGTDALRRIAKAIPWFWPVVACRGLAQPQAVESQRTPSLRPTYALGALVLVTNSLCGFTLTDSWPVGVYPTFATIVEAKSIPSLAMYPLNPAGEARLEVELLYDPSLRNVYPLDRLPYVLLEVLRKPAGREERLLGLWNIWIADHPDFQDTSRVTFALVEYSTLPEDAKKNPISKQGLLTIDIPSPSVDLP